MVDVLRRFYISISCKEGNVFRIPAHVVHHMHKVFRLKENDQVMILAGNNTAYIVKLVSLRKNSAKAEIIEQRAIPRLDPPFVHLAISVPKFSTIEGVLEKAVELGVTSITPFLSDHSFVRKNIEEVEKKRQRWEKIILMSTQQCARGDLLHLHKTLLLDEILQHVAGQKKVYAIFSYEGEATRHIKDEIAQLKKSNPENIWLFIGSEGGFSKQEAEQFSQQGFAPVTLGPRVLRVETACTSLISIVQYELGKLAL